MAWQKKSANPQQKRQRSEEEAKALRGMKNGQRYPIGYSEVMDKAILAKEVLESELELTEARSIRKP